MKSITVSNSLVDILSPNGSRAIGQERSKATPSSNEKTQGKYITPTAHPTKNERASKTQEAPSPTPRTISYTQEKQAHSSKNIGKPNGVGVTLIVLISVVTLGGGALVSLGGNKVNAIPDGKALFKSGRTGMTEEIGVRLSNSINSNGHTVYDATWSDGNWSSYVFWNDGNAEIFSKNGSGAVEKTSARYSRNSKGDCVIHAVTNAVTVFPGLNPIVNYK